MLPYIGGYGLVGALIFHGLYNNDAAVLGGVTTAYALFLAGIF